jgi:CubicO group peptidase (beta-lactamase class C family)
LLSYQIRKEGVLVMAGTLLDLSKFTETDFKLLDEQVQAAMERYGIPGVAVGIAYGDQEYLAGYGVTSVENPLPVTPDTLFQIGSTTKTMTATAIMRLVDMGKIELDAPVRRYLPDLALKDPATAETVTVKHLLTHTAGWLGDFFAETGWGEDALAQYVARMADISQVTPVGEHWSYNNASFSLAGRVIEAVTGKPYEVSLKELLLDPLEMKNSFFFAHEVIAYRVAIGHRKEESGPTVIRQWALPRSANPAGGVCTTIKDQLRYARFHMGDGTTPDGTQLLKPESMTLMHTPVTSAGGDDQIALSWFIAKVGEVEVHRHGGSTFGQNSAFVLAPDQKFAIVVVTNSDEGSQLHEAVTNWVFEHFLEAKKTEPETISLPAEQLAAYAGNYSAVLTSVELAAAENGETLVGTFRVHTDGFFEKDPPPIPGIRFAFYGEDKVISLDEPFKAMKGEFIRNKEGKITWFRFGGRMSTRQGS